MKKRSKFNTSLRAPQRKFAWAFAPAMALAATASAQFTGPSSTATPYLLPSASGVTTKSILTVGDTVNFKPDGITPYRMVGLPDGLGAYDNGDNTFTVLMNHEISGAGSVRAHGANGAFVSEWIIGKSSFQVTHGADLIQQVSLWNSGSSTFNAPAAGVTSFARFCSADLADTTAFFDAASGLGTLNRIFLNGEENGTEGRAFGHVATGAAKGTSYELASLGKFSWENAVANPFAQAKTLVIGTDDNASDGGVYLYVGTKQNNGNDVQRAGLTGGNLYGIAVSGVTAETRANGVSGTFSLFNHGNVSGTTGAALNTAGNAVAAGGTDFLRPEDGAWDPEHPNDFYFVTTDRADTAKDGLGNAQVGRTRLYKLHFTDLANPENGGTITSVLPDTHPGQMFDNISVKDGKIVLQEDIGGNAHNGKVWVYDIATGTLNEMLHHDVARFGTIGTPATAPFSQDEEASGAIDITGIIGGAGKTYLMVDQAHYGIAGELVEGGQLFVVNMLDSAFVPVPEASTYLAGGFLVGVVGLTSLLRRRNMKANA